MKLGILTGGGDVPGLNPCIKAAVVRALESHMDVIGFRRGWAGLLNINPENPDSIPENSFPLVQNTVRKIDRTGGTFLHTSRTNPQNVNPRETPEFLEPANIGETKDFTKHILKNLEYMGIDVLIAIGGDDTLSYAVRLNNEGFPIVGIPKTMDNDVFGTDYCIGFSTAVTRSVEMITALRTSAGSHERIAIIELFGRNSGETSLISAYLADVNRAIISEVPFDPEKLANFLKEDYDSNPSHYAIMTISEGASFLGGTVIEEGEPDAYGHKKLGGIGKMTSEIIRKITKKGIIYQTLAYLMRSGAPDSLDRMVAKSFGTMAIEMALKGRTGKMVALQDGKYTAISLETIQMGEKRVDVREFYDIDNYRPFITTMFGKPMFLY
ncbi:MAG: ATP-dependent 6-phosphofructokinase [Candidatus Coatesbacteria bacterium]|nr:ATP-dependent 6-phosphofructokinase [Candidatus Coatesbacteria bacterium]